VLDGISIGVPFRAEAKRFSHHSVYTGSGVYPAFYTMVTTGSFSGVKWLGREADHSPPFNAEVKNGETISPLLHKSSWSSA
jgi:hypothetical protein